MWHRWSNWLRHQRIAKGQCQSLYDSNPAGPVHPRQELTQDSNGNWGKDLAPGSYKLFVTDGCMDIVVPNATVLQTENKALAKADNECISIDILPQILTNCIQVRNRS